MDKKILEGRVRTACDQDFICGSDGYFDSMRKALKPFDDKTVRITIEVIEDSTI